MTLEPKWIMGGQGLLIITLQLYLGLGPSASLLGPLMLHFLPYHLDSFSHSSLQLFFWMGPRQDHKDTMPPSPPLFLLQNPCFNANLKYRRKVRDLSCSPSVSRPTHKFTRQVQYQPQGEPDCTGNPSQKPEAWHV